MKKIILMTCGIICAGIYLQSCTYKKQSLCNPSNTITYTNAIKTIMAANCVGCHGGASPSAGINLENYQVLTAYAKDQPIFMGCINHTLGKAMPQGGAKMADTTIAKIQTWVNGCMPE
jgi:mono/diheme cytochrome c family protein